jgi:hypothetical protein
MHNPLIEVGRAGEHMKVRHIRNAREAKDVTEGVMMYINKCMQYSLLDFIHVALGYDAPEDQLCIDTLCVTDSFNKAWYDKFKMSYNFRRSSYVNPTFDEFIKLVPNDIEYKAVTLRRMYNNFTDKVYVPTGFGKLTDIQRNFIVKSKMIDGKRGTYYVRVKETPHKESESILMDK